MKDLLIALNSLKDKKNKIERLKKVSLKSKKVDLSLLDDFKSKYAEAEKTLEKSLNDVLRPLSLAKEAVFELQASIDDLSPLYNESQEIKDSITDFGIDVPSELERICEALEELSYIDLRSDMETAIEQAEDVASDIYQKYFI
tara:strand:- start:2914 stop:3342 length:429 start_codon:yes stop_codon:yes gene_type:complete